MITKQNHRYHVAIMKVLGRINRLDVAEKQKIVRNFKGLIRSLGLGL